MQARMLSTKGNGNGGIQEKTRLICGSLWGFNFFFGWRTVQVRSLNWLVPTKFPLGTVTAGWATPLGFTARGVGPTYVVPQQALTIWMFPRRGLWTGAPWNKEISPPIANFHSRRLSTLNFCTPQWPVAPGGGRREGRRKKTCQILGGDRVWKRKSLQKTPL